jgi:glycosyltransferase involved in cell wall biosynthesis
VVDPSNEQEIADVVLRLLNSPDVAIEMGKNARKAFEQEFNWRLEEEKLLQVYGELESKIRK